MAEHVSMSNWEVLDIPPGSDSETIRKAYRKMALLHHPDKGGDPARFREIAEAYVALSATSETPRGRPSRTEYETADPYEIFARFFGREHNGVSFATLDEINNDADAAIFG